MLQSEINTSGLNVNHNFLGFANHCHEESTILELQCEKETPNHARMKLWGLNNKEYKLAIDLAIFWHKEGFNND